MKEMAIKDWNNLTPEDWDEIVGGIKQFQKDFPPLVRKVEMTEEEKIKAQKIIEEYRKKNK